MLSLRRSNLPFQDKSLESISCLCVLEHIGLGRYADKLDPNGTDKAILEMIRVLSTGGNLYISVPLGNQDEIHFNAYRIFSLRSLISKFSGLKLEELSLTDGNGIYDQGAIQKFDLDKQTVIGLFHFKKPIDS